MKKIYIALVVIFLCGIAVVVYVYLAGADRRAIEKTLDNARAGVNNSDPNLVLAQVSRDYDYDGYSYTVLSAALPPVLKSGLAPEVTFSNMEITIDGNKAHAKFHFSMQHSLKKVLGESIQWEMVTSGDADITLAKEADGWKITEASIRDENGNKVRLP
jgi:hypothetical protein